jgi:hypothetical protein
MNSKKFLAGKIFLFVLLPTVFLAAASYSIAQASDEPAIAPNNGNNRSIGGEKDVHGCYIAAGYSWCESKNKCLRTWEEDCFKIASNTIEVIGGEKDSQGCLIPAGYSWCESKQKCLRAWEENCPASSHIFGQKIRKESFFEKFKPVFRGMFFR